MKKTQLPAIILALIMCVSLVSCGDSAVKEPAETTEAAAGEQTAAQVGTTIPETTQFNALNVLGKRDLGGETLTFYTRSYNGEWSSDLLYEEITGEAITSAIASRNLKIMTDYNVKFAEKKSGAQSYYAEAEKQLAAGAPDFDVMYLSMRDAAQMSVDGYLLQVNKMENLSLDESWWSPFLQPQLSIAGKNYYVTGEITTIDDISIRAIFFNKTMLNDIDSSVNLYDMVSQNKWMLEDMFKLVNSALSDVGEDGKIVLGTDKIGLLAEGTLGYQLLMGTGEKIISKDSEDTPIISVSESRPIEVIDWLTQHVANNLAVQTGDSVYIPFAEGGVLFGMATIARENNLKGYEIDFGMVPYPKYNSDQEEYHCYSDSYCPNAIAFPFGLEAARVELGTFVCEALAIESVNTVTPQFYDIAMKIRNARDERFGEMLDIIRDNYMIDLADVFLNTWALRTPVTKAISSGTSIVTTVKGLEKSAKQKIKTTTTKIAELDH